MPEHQFKIRGGIRVVPRRGGGVRADAGWPMATLKADKTSIVLREPWAGSLVVTSESLTAIRPWSYAINTGLLFDVKNLDELWIFRTYCSERVRRALADLGWTVEP